MMNEEDLAILSELDSVLPEQAPQLDSAQPSTGRSVESDNEHYQEASKLIDPILTQPICF